jgi:hypothetical protein
MNSRQWLAYYQANKTNRPEPKWNSPSPIDPPIQQILARSLSHFQLGETGEGKALIGQARIQTPNDSVYHEALELFIAEEGEHARLLERLVLRFGGTTIKRHWTHALFRLIRQGAGFRFEIQVLLIAELVGAAYYRLLRARTRDLVLEDTCTLLLKDEKQHIDFHAAWLGHFLSRLLPLETEAWRVQFQTLFSIATLVAWIDHRAALAVSGSNRREFFNEARRECIRFLHELERNINLALVDASEKRPYLTAECA